MKTFKKFLTKEADGDKAAEVKKLMADVTKILKAGGNTVMGLKSGATDGVDLPDSAEAYMTIDSKSFYIGPKDLLKLAKKNIGIGVDKNELSFMRLFGF